MSIKKLGVTGFVGLVLLLSGCGGGGGGGGSVKPTVGISGYNLDTGLADTKKGAAYLQEFLTTNNAQSTEVSDLYSRLNLGGVEQAHKDGWTGKGKTIAILDSVFGNVTGHGRMVSDIAGTVAPGATRDEFELNFYINGSAPPLNNAEILQTIGSDIITTSAGYIPSFLITKPSLVEDIKHLIRDIETSDALMTVAAQHGNWSGNAIIDGIQETGRGGYPTCPNPNNAAMTVEKCNSWAIQGLDTDNIIYVGEIDKDGNIPLWSNQAGDTHKNQFIVTSSDYITTKSDEGTHGNSFAAPRVAGAGALVRHKFPNLNNSQTAVIILHTADDLGVAGVDAVYGHGKLNVGNALAPIGKLH